MTVSGIVALMQARGSDVDIAEGIKRNLPERTYSGVSVSRGGYNFGGLGVKASKIITLCPTGENVKEFTHRVRRYFSGFPVSPTYNTTLLCQYLLNQPLSYEHKQMAKEELRRACGEQRRIFIYISQDLCSMECRVEDARGKCSIQ